MKVTFLKQALFLGKGGEKRKRESEGRRQGEKGGGERVRGREMFGL